MSALPARSYEDLQQCQEQQALEGSGGMSLPEPKACDPELALRANGGFRAAFQPSEGIPP